MAAVLCLKCKFQVTKALAMSSVIERLRVLFLDFLFNGGPGRQRSQLIRFDIHTIQLTESVWS